MLQVREEDLHSFVKPSKMRLTRPKGCSFYVLQWGLLLIPDTSGMKIRLDGSTARGLGIRAASVRCPCCWTAQSSSIFSGVDQ